MNDLETASKEPARDGHLTDGRAAGFGWRLLQVIAAFIFVASMVVPMLISGTLEPFLLSMAAPVAIGLLLMLRWPRVGAIWLGVVSLALLLFSAPFILDALAHPESLADFVPLAAFTVSALVVTLATIPAFRKGDTGSRGARATGLVATAVVVAAAVVSIVAFTRVESVLAQSGDVRVVTEAFEFRPVSVEADVGKVSVHVTNADSTRHTFTIDALGIDLELPPNTSQRVSFEADDGTYRFYCRPHAPDMEGELVVG